MNDHQCEAMTKSGLRCRRVGRPLCDTHSGAQAARKVRYGVRRPGEILRPRGEHRLSQAEDARRAS